MCYPEPSLAGYNLTELSHWLVSGHPRFIALKLSMNVVAQRETAGWRKADQPDS